MKEKEHFMNPEAQRNYMNSISRLMDLSLMLQNINKVLEAKCGLSLVQWSLLKTLINMPAVSPLVLAKTLKITPGTLSQTLTRLDRKEYLFMCDDPTDARKKMISITRLGKDALTAVGKEFERVFSEIDLIDGEIEKIDNYLRQKVKVYLLGPDMSEADENQEFSVQDKTL